MLIHVNDTYSKQQSFLEGKVLHSCYTESFRIKLLNLIILNEFQYNIYFHLTLYTFQLMNKSQVWVKVLMDNNQNRHRGKSKENLIKRHDDKLQIIIHSGRVRVCSKGCNTFSFLLSLFHQKMKQIMSVVQVHSLNS